MDRGARWTTVHGVARSWTQLSNFEREIHYPLVKTESYEHI